VLTSKPKCDSDSDDAGDKEYRITDIDFDNGKYLEETLFEEFGFKICPWDEFNKSLIEETCSKTWFACDEEQLCNKILDETGWLINSFSCERVCEKAIKPTDGDTADEFDPEMIERLSIIDKLG